MPAGVVLIAQKICNPFFYIITCVTAGDIIAVSSPVLLPHEERKEGVSLSRVSLTGHQNHAVQHTHSGLFSFPPGYPRASRARGPHRRRGAKGSAGQNWFRGKYRITRTSRESRETCLIHHHWVYNYNQQGLPQRVESTARYGQFCIHVVRPSIAAALLLGPLVIYIASALLLWPLVIYSQPPRQDPSIAVVIGVLPRP